MGKTQTNDSASFEKVWLLLQENSIQLKETRAILDEKFRATDEKFQETRAIMDERSRETDRQILKTDKIVRNLTNKVTESEKRWGKFVEALVEGKLVEMLNKRGIPVNLTLQRIKGKNDYEIDLIAKNGIEIVVVEVKTTLGIEDVNHFIDKLKIFKNVITEFKDNTIYGAVAYIQQDSEAQKYAAKKGLLVIKAVGESAKIENKSNFKPKEW